jgi:UDP-N-acetyl-D-glucosamine dehydrogenase
MELIDKVQKREAAVAVIGLGYVGLPLAVEKAKAGFKVTGIERKLERVEKVNRGENYIPDVVGAELSEVVRDGKFRATQSFEPIAEVDIITICVPTPLDKNKNPDTRYIEHVVDRSLPHLKRGQLMILESTTYPGTTEEVILPRIQSRGFQVGEDFYLAFSPERIDPGNKSYRLKEIPKVVGGVTQNCGRAAKALYEAVLESPVFVASSPRVAEMAKLLENVFRVVNVSLVNELAMLCDRMGIDIWEVIEAASTKPFGFMPFYPGPGMGGHCVPVDPFYLVWKAKEYGFITHFIELAGEINDRMPPYVVQRVVEILNEREKALRGSKLLLVGLAYKRDIGDLRESPALKIAKLLLEGGAHLSYHDPYVPEVVIEDGRFSSVPLTPEVLKESDLVLITTDHSNVDYHLIAEHAPLIYDTRNALKSLKREGLYRLGG